MNSNESLHSTMDLDEHDAWFEGSIQKAFGSNRSELVQRFVDILLNCLTRFAIDSLIENKTEKEICLLLLPRCLVKRQDTEIFKLDLDTAKEIFKLDRPSRLEYILAKFFFERTMEMFVAEGVHDLFTQMMKRQRQSC